MSKFRADCSQCCGLCCVASAFFAFQGFGADKQAQTPCVHLNSEDKCSIHCDRDHYGYTACAGFDCYGAGQWVTQSLYAGASWRHTPELADSMFRAYRTCLPVFELAAMLDAAIPLADPSACPLMRDKQDDLLKLCTPRGTNALRFDINALRLEVMQIIRTAVPEDRRSSQ